LYKVPGAAGAATPGLSYYLNLLKLR